ncbi:HAD-IC family P-type ATPase [Corynebacterium freiburgense]|uniref:HAD-IC family P-type ATPase n=1 Tax=Corynebacterium freiburgense TaxID=556548 RepID=UPI0004231B87|nr:HAD-IC family P-type ATPase [Corynebacterium freiburgense]WJZ02036.1 Calcium-transporting ATPase 1 [Corynebacterium freiburgense]
MTYTSPFGLTAQEVADRVQAGLVNRQPRRTGRSVGTIIRTNVFTRINAILGVLLFIVLSLGSWINSAFGTLIIANSAIGIIQELRAKRTLDKLTILGESLPTVIRDGQAQEILRDALVLDDLIELGSGDQLVVDGEVRSADGLMVDESMLTGESEPILKNIGDQVWSGSYVVAGAGTYQATAISEDAYAAKLVAEAGKFQLTDSHLQAGIDQILRTITWLLIPTGLLTVWTQLSRTGEPLRESILAMVAALVPMLPEGLVLMTSIAFGVGVVRLGRRKALVNELPAIEGLARVDVVCVDKTGTLTENRMELAEIKELIDAPIARILASFVAVENRPNDTLQAVATVDAEPFEVISFDAFDSAKKFASVNLESHGRWYLGAPDVLVSRSDAEAAEALAAQGLRVLMLCDENRTPAALVVLRQKIRDDALDTLDFFRQEDVDVKVISGDNAASVGAVARELGLCGSVVDARQLPEDPEAFRQAIEQHTVFGRVTPEQKREMVRALQENGHTVAMTGDGVNDVLALKDANIGVSMGSGSPATRSVAQVVILDNRFASLPHVVAEGRRVIGNIERVANLFLTKTVYSVLMALIFAIVGIKFPFQAIHVTVTAWFTIGIPAFILSLAPNYERARPNFVPRVLRFAVPSGITIGTFTAGMWLWLYPGAAAPEELKMQVGTAALAALLVMALWVLGIVARPYTWWKALLLLTSVSFYIVLFSTPWLANFFLLHPEDHGLLLRGLVVGACGAAIIEGFWQLRRLNQR